MGKRSAASDAPAPRPRPHRARRGTGATGEGSTDAAKSGTADAKDALAPYRDLRDPATTPEPFGAERAVSAGGTWSGRFVVHLHRARSEHFDLRLEAGGALASFAVPRGPSLDPEQKRLAVRTEDHPLEYVDFEGVIPEGNYGAGPMIVWDAGAVRYLERSVEEGLSAGKVDFELSGFKLRGRFALVATGKRRKEPGAERQWLLIKKRDAYATGGDEPLPGWSVLSGLNAEQLNATRELGDRLVSEARALGAAPVGRRAGSLEPMLCAAHGASLQDPERVYELKLDGVRLLAERAGAEVVLRHRSGRVATSSWPELARSLGLLPVDQVVLDGEVVTFDREGRPSFQKLLPRLQAVTAADVERARAAAPVSYLVFDLLELGGLDLRPLPLVARKALLGKLLLGRGHVRWLDHLEGDGRPLLALCREHSLEGLVAKRKSSPYRHGPRRSADWVKVKVERDEDFVVVGYTPGKGTRGAVGALELGTYEGDRLVYRGKVGSGFDRATLEGLGRMLAAREGGADVAGLPREPGRRSLRPELVARVRFGGFSEEGHLRFPVFLGLRDDVSPRECRVTPPHAPALETPAEAPGADAGRLPARTRARLSNLDKPFWPELGLTKGDLVAYYAAVSEVLLPYLRERPLVLVRHPDGVHGKSFFQWRAPPGTPSWIRTLELAGEGEGHKRVFLVDGVDALLHVVNLGAIPLHVLPWRETAPGALDWLVLDFDRGEQPFAWVVRLALSLRELLGELGLVGYPKTSGQSGLHVFVPLGGASNEVARLLADLLGRLLVQRHPELATVERRVDARGPRVLVDTGQTGRSRTIVAPYSVRAVPTATVSTPLEWNEVHLALDPARFTLRTVPERVGEVGDLWRGLLEHRPDLPQVLRAMEVLLGGPRG